MPIAMQCTYERKIKENNIKGKTIGSSIENCARVIRENRFAIAAISDETEPCINNPWCTSQWKK